ncbi:Tol-Pal system peptidoglycan-associated lipoprotein PAL [hydrothermal vent metagenome]|uniref:Tol-Pal system peptidoglycan-associated lipoprotein PAL n=1 Tax=hydrothermal vent metagenome TaxID=652676 RepID=A0A3B0VN51_9ZZZZ
MYFDFDQAIVRSDQIPLLEQNADYLKQTPDVKVIVEGNCDERGTNEYNLALGERRALNGKKFLVELGVAPDRIRTISYGEERPLFTGHDEFAWSHNRRDDFVIE